MKRYGLSVTGYSTVFQDKNANNTENTKGLH